MDSEQVLYLLKETYILGYLNGLREARISDAQAQGVAEESWRTYEQLHRKQLSQWFANQQSETGKGYTGHP